MPVYISSISVRELKPIFCFDDIPHKPISMDACEMYKQIVLRCAPQIVEGSFLIPPCKKCHPSHFLEYIHTTYLLKKPHITVRLAFFADLIGP